MKKIFLTSILLLISLSSFALTDADIEYIIDLGIRYPGSLMDVGIATKSETAVAIGEAVAREVYGDEVVNRFIPFSATEDDDHKVWYVKGVPLRFGYDSPLTVVGPIVTIRKYDGTIISVHYGQ